MHHLIQTLFQYRLPLLLALTLLLIIGCSASPSRGASKMVDFRQRDLAKISIEHTPSTAVVSQPIQNNYALLLLENAIQLQLADENRLQTDDAIHSLRLQLKILSYQDNVLLAQGKLYDDDEYLVYSQVKRRFAANENWEEVMELVAEQMLDELMLKMRDLQQSAITEAPTRYFAYSSNYYNIYNNPRPRIYNTITYSNNPVYSDPYYNNWGWWRRHRNEHDVRRDSHQHKPHDEKHQDHYPENHPRRHWVDNDPSSNPPLLGPSGRPRHGSKPDLRPAPTTLTNTATEAAVKPITAPSNGPIVTPPVTEPPAAGSTPANQGINSNTGISTPPVETSGMPTTPATLPSNSFEVNPVLDSSPVQVISPTNGDTTSNNPTTGSSAGLPPKPIIDSNTGIVIPPIGTSVDTGITPISGPINEPTTVPSLDSNSGLNVPTPAEPNLGTPPNLSTETNAIDQGITPTTSGTSYDNGSNSVPSSSTGTGLGIGSSGSITMPSSDIESGSTGTSSSVSIPDSSPSYNSGSSVGSSSMDSSPSYSSGSSSSSSNSDSSSSYSSGSSVGSSSMDSSPSYSSGSSSSSSSSSAPEPAPPSPPPAPAPEPAPPPPPKSAPPASDNTATPPSP
ncbi:MAG: hypothetical protein Q8Q40_01270 [Methylococcaceae bacterium]|nr:hypothetical protein [Methylococcaceae bacterium]MDP3902589.1 hypothetical protein [Methylococcaceae bacterium]